MPNKTIPDWKKAVIIAMSNKYGYRAIGSRIDLNYKTVKKYQKEAEDKDVIEMDDGIDMRVANVS